VALLDAVAASGVTFAYVKATECLSAADPQLATNLEAAQDAGVLIGGYHFLSFDSPGEQQAEHVIATVPSRSGTLRPRRRRRAVRDVLRGPTVGGDRPRGPRPAAGRAEADYGAPPVLDATPESYDRYLRGRYPDNPLWIRSVAGWPTSDGDWTFWQYSNRDDVPGTRADLDAPLLP
jgi:lysozyme